MSTATKTKTDELRELLKNARDIAAKAETDGPDGKGRNLTDAERTEIEEILAKASAMKNQAVTEAAISGLEDEVEILEGRPKGSSLDGVTRFAGFKAKTLGQAFIEDEDVVAWREEIAPAGGQVHEKRRVESPAFGFEGLKAFGYHQGTGKPSGAKALVTGVDDASAGALIVPDFLGIQDDGALQRDLTLLDVITRGSTESDTVEYVRIVSFDNQAATVPEATQVAHTGDEVATKPESGITLQKITEAVKTIAHWLPATRRALSDAAQIRTLIDNFLRYGLMEELEDQVLNGDGVGENFTGILNTSGVQVQPWSNDLLETARKAKTKVKVIGKARANAYAVHPNDAERLDLLKDLEGRYYFGGPATDGAQPLWRLPVVETEAITEGNALCGAFQMAVLWDREQAAISVSDSHADFFIRNLIAILAELRAAFGIFRPAAFVQFPTTSTSSSAA